MVAFPLHVVDNFRSVAQWNNFGKVEASVSSPTQRSMLSTHNLTCFINTSFAPYCCPSLKWANGVESKNEAKH